MANPSPEAVAAIRSRVTDWTRTDAAILADLNAATVDNPKPAQQVRKPLTVAAAMALVSQDSRVKVYQRNAVVVAFRDDLVSGDLAGAVNWLTLAKEAGDVTADEFNSIFAAAQATQPDPTYRPKLSWAETTIGRPLDLRDIQAARPA